MWDNPGALSDLAFKYGPFFFSVLFVIFLTRWAYQKYNASAVRQPPLSLADQNINRWMFLATFVAGLLLVVVSVAWWWKYRPQVYLLRGVILDLQPEEVVAADDYYLRVQLKQAISDEDRTGLRRNEHFIIAQAQPFALGQTFELDLSKNGQRHERLWVAYTGSDDEAQYVIDYTAAGPKLTLAQSPPTTRVGAMSWEAVVHAAESQGSGALARQEAISAAAVTASKTAAVLQAPASQVATKLNVIDQLSQMSIADARAYLSAPGSEPLALTLLDLSQHSDRELAAKAAALTKRLNVDGFLATQLSSADKNARLAAEAIMLRIPTAHATTILGAAAGSPFPDVQQTLGLVRAGTSTQVLKATASNQGDRYYVKASWNPSDATVTSCLTKLFNATLVSSRTLAEDQKLMSGRSTRYVYWYTKDWALKMASDIRSCGGTAEFVTGQ